MVSIFHMSCLSLVLLGVVIALVWQTILNKMLFVEEHVSNKYTTFQEFLDNEQYTKEGIESYEKVFGRYFVGVGGLDATKIFASQLNLKPGQMVLDIGCGIGGSAFYMAKTFGVKVLGIDLSSNMINIALERQKEVGTDDVFFEIADVLEIDLPKNHFDVIYSRDTLLHLKDKPEVFQKIFSWLKPGGTLQITDYCCFDGEWSDEFSKYVKGRGYYLIPVKTYVKELEDAGFTDVQGEDINELFLKSLQDELQRIKDTKEEYEKTSLGAATYQYRLDGWQDKIKRAQEKEQVWGYFMATKPE